MAIIDNPDQLDAEAVVLENKRLTTMLRAMLEKTGQNEAKLKKFQQLELELLNTVSISALIDTLTVSFRNKLDLNAATLLLFDPCGTVRELLQEVDAKAVHENLEFEDQARTFDELYARDYSTRLRHNNPALAQRLFPGSHDIRSFAMLPLVSNGIIVGSYHLGSGSPVRFSQGLSTDFYQHFARIIAVCLENTVNHCRLKHLSLIDPLTNTRNRRSLYQSLKQEIARCEREQKPLSLLFIDLDHFKKINDQYGHAAGDKTLIDVAKAIGPNLRATDMLARFGGEEFTAVLPNCGAEEAQIIAERIRTIIESLSLQCPEGTAFNVTCSVGGTTWYPQGLPCDRTSLLEKIIKTSDEAAYEVKSSGRNACRWRDLVL